MSDLGFNFDPSTVEDSDDFAPIPAGDYAAICEKAEVKPTKAGNGKYINFQWKITGPNHVNRVLFDMVIIQHENDKAQRIGRQKLKSLCDATGIGAVTDSSVFVGRSAVLKVKVRAANGDYDASNEVKKYASAGGPPVGAPMGQAAPEAARVAQAAPAQPSQPGAPAWA